MSLDTRFGGWGKGYLRHPEGLTVKGELLGGLVLLLSEVRLTGRDLSSLQKTIIYGLELPLEALSPHTITFLNEFKDDDSELSLDPLQAALLHGMMSHLQEASEILDLFCQHIFEGEDLDLKVLEYLRYVQSGVTNVKGANIEKFVSTIAPINEGGEGDVEANADSSKAFPEENNESQNEGACGHED